MTKISVNYIKKSGVFHIRLYEFNDYMGIEDLKKLDFEVSTALEDALRQEEEDDKN